MAAFKQAESNSAKPINGSGWRCGGTPLLSLSTVLPGAKPAPGLLGRMGTAITAVRRRACCLCYDTSRAPTARSRGSAAGARARRQAGGRRPGPQIRRAVFHRRVRGPIGRGCSSIDVRPPPRLDLPLPARSGRWSRLEDSMSGSQYLHLEAGRRRRGWSERRCRQENGDHPGTDLPTSAVRRVEVLAVQADASMTEVEILEAVRHLPALGSLVDE